ncbi:hypothetical protein J6590_096088 [Homalodisca vitripennis]|nr:hypothetical protein J6590_096088 [Homalodisca vitripennis]
MRETSQIKKGSDSTLRLDLTDHGLVIHRLQNVIKKVTNEMDQPKQVLPSVCSYEVVTSKREYASPDGIQTCVLSDDNSNTRSPPSA